MDAQPLIEFRNVTKRFGDRTILDGIDFKIYEGEVTTIIGLSGTGKSVSLKHIIGLLKPDRGEILYRGKPITRMSRQEWNDYIGRISYMFQNNALFDSMTVFENVALPLSRTTRLGRREIEKRAMARIEQAELTEVAHKYPSEISGGMQKRAALARAMVTDPQVVLFDEPTTGQDPIRKNAILQMIAHYKKLYGFTAILISHEIPDVFFISNRVLVLWDKKIVFEGPPEEMESSEHPFRDEIVQSLESLQKELTGLYSRRHFKVRYQTDLAGRGGDDTYAVLVFSFDNMDAISAAVSHDAAQQVQRSLGTYLRKHFGAVGGFSSRQTINEFVTILPFSDLDEARRILEDFVEDFRGQGMAELARVFREKIQQDACFDFSVSVGMAPGKTQIEIESVIEFARFNKKLISNFQCETRRGLT
ncbi:MAG: ATP-binding cassette domain-containing protein [Desulfobacterales bacterium]